MHKTAGELKANKIRMGLDLNGSGVSPHSPGGWRAAAARGVYFFLSIVRTRSNYFSLNSYCGHRETKVTHHSQHSQDGMFIISL